MNAVASAPTKDTQAYDLFLKGEYEERISNSNFRAESFDQVQTRVLAVWRRVTAEVPDQTLVIVAHGVVCKVLLLLN